MIKKRTKAPNKYNVGSLAFLYMYKCSIVNYKLTLYFNTNFSTKCDFIQQYQKALAETPNLIVSYCMYYKQEKRYCFVKSFPFIISY